MFETVPDDLSNSAIMVDYMSECKAVFFTMSAFLDSPMENGDEWGMMPYIGEDGSKNIYMYSSTSYKIAFVNNGYTEEVKTAYGAVTEVGSLKDFVRNWLTEQGTVSPDKIIWE